MSKPRTRSFQCKPQSTEICAEIPTNGECIVIFFQARKHVTNDLA